MLLPAIAQTTPAMSAWPSLRVQHGGGAQEPPPYKPNSSRIRLLICSIGSAPLLQGIPPEHRPWVWMELSGANRKKREHMASYYEAMVDMGETSSEFLHQIELVHPSSCARHPSKTRCIPLQSET